MLTSDSTAWMLLETRKQPVSKVEAGVATSLLLADPGDLSGVSGDVPGGTFRQTGPLGVWGEYSLWAKGGPGRGGPGRGTKDRLTCCCRVAAGFREPESRVQQGNSSDAGPAIRARCLISEREPCAKDSARPVAVLEGSVSEVVESILVADGEM